MVPKSVILKVTGDTMQMFKVKSQRSRSQGKKSRSQRNEMHQQQTRYVGPTAMDKFSDFKKRFFFLFYQSIVFSSHAVDGHQMYFGIEISPTYPLIFKGCQKV